MHTDTSLNKEEQFVLQILRRDSVPDSDIFPYLLSVRMKPDEHLFPEVTVGNALGFLAMCYLSRVPTVETTNKMALYLYLYQKYGERLYFLEQSIMEKLSDRLTDLSLINLYRMSTIQTNSEVKRANFYHLVKLAFNVKLTSGANLKEFAKEITEYSRETYNELIESKEKNSKICFSIVENFKEMQQIKDTTSSVLTVFFKSSIVDLVLQCLDNFHQSWESWIPQALRNLTEILWSSFGMLLDSTNLTIEKLLYESPLSRLLIGTYQTKKVVLKKDVNAQKNTLREAEIMVRIMQLKSNYLLKLEGVIFASGYLLVMEYMHNGNLYDFLQSNSKIGWKMCYQLALDVTKGVCHLHQLNFVHMDVKSQNVLLDNNYRAILSDFSNSILIREPSKAKLAETPRKITPELFKKKLVIPNDDLRINELRLTKSLWSVAPEQLFEEIKPTTAIDIYSLGRLLFELAAHETSVTVTSLFAPIPEGTPEEFKAVIRDCIQLESEKRPTAASVETRLETILNKEAIGLKLRQHSASPNVPDKAYLNLLQEAKAAGVINQISSNGNTPLHWAAKTGHPDKYKHLIAVKADENILNGQNQTPKQLLNQRLESKNQRNYLPENTELKMPSDNSCLFWAAAIGALIPVLQDEKQYRLIFNILFITDKTDEYLYLQYADTFKKRIQAFLKSNVWTLGGSPIKKDPLYVLINLYFRQKVANYIHHNSSQFKESITGSIETYVCDKVRQENFWGGAIEIHAIYELLQKKYHIKVENSFIDLPASSGTHLIHLVHTNAQDAKSSHLNHYNLRMPKLTIENSSSSNMRLMRYS